MLHPINLVVSTFYFDLVPPFYFLNEIAIFQPVKSCQNTHVILESTSQLFFKFYINLQCHQTQLFCTFLAQALYALVKRSPLKVQIFEIFDWLGQNSSNCGVNFKTTSLFLFKFCIILHCHDITPP